MTKPLFTTRRIYFLYLFFLDFGLAWTATIFVPGLKKLGISVQEIGLMESLFWTALLISEIPAGLYADRVSRVRALALSSGILSMGGLIYMAATNLSSVILAEITIGIGLALGGNSLRTWITNAIKEEETDPGKREQALTRTFATAQIFRSVVALCAGALGGMITHLNQLVIWWPITIGGGINLLIVMLIMTKKGELKKEKKERTQKQLFTRGIVAFLHQPTLWWATGAATLFGMLVPYYNYWTLYFRASVGEGNMSAIWICSFIPIMMGGWLVRRFGHGGLSEAGSVLASLSLPSLALAVLALTEEVPTQVGMLILLQLGRGVFQPLMETFLAKRIEDEVRTTVLAIISTLSKLACVILPAGVYWFGSEIPDSEPLIRTIWIATSSCMIATLAILWLLRPRK